MEIEFDPDKDAANIAKHGISLTRVLELTIWQYRLDSRFDYGEERFRAWGTIDGRGYCLIFVRRAGRLRAISLRRAHQKEMDRYVPKTSRF